LIPGIILLIFPAAEAAIKSPTNKQEGESMKEKLFNIDDVVSLLRREVQACGSQEAFATKAGVSQQYVGDILRGQRLPGEKILNALGLEKIAYYRMIPAVRINRHTGKIELKAANGPWGLLPSRNWDFDPKTQKFVLRHGTKKIRYPVSKTQNDPEYIYGEVAIGVHGEIVTFAE
jgi:transcriptional regulator with XRE-family HTH domain